MNKTNVTLLSVILIAGMISVSTARAGQNCDTRRTAIENQIRIAGIYGNTGKITGLQRALANVNKYCVDRRIAQDNNRKPENNPAGNQKYSR